MNKIEIFNETDNDINIKELKFFLNFALDYESINNVEFNVIFVSKSKIKELNKTYRNKNDVTDVISFAFSDYKDVIYDRIKILGDIYICFDKAYEQSIEFNNSLKFELRFLSLHGLLHLLQYDHINIEDERVMMTKEKEILGIYEKKHSS